MDIASLAASIVSAQRGQNAQTVQIAALKQQQAAQEAIVAVLDEAASRTVPPAATPPTVNTVA